MPLDSILLSIAVCGVFLLFALVLAWIDYSTNQWRRGNAAEKQPAAAVADERPRRAA